MNSQSAKLNLATAAAIGTILLILWLLRLILLPFVFAAALAYIAAPLVREMLRIRWPRPLAAVLVFMIYLILLAALGYCIKFLAVPALLDLGVRGHLLLHETIRQILHGEEAQFMGRTITASELTGRIIDHVIGFAVGPTQAIDAITLASRLVMGTLLTLVLLFYFLLDGPRLLAGLLWLVPPRLRPRAQAIALDVDPLIGRYLRGVLVIVIYAAGATWVGTGVIFHWPHAVILSVTTAVLELIPVAGPILSAAMLGAVALQRQSFTAALGFAAFALVLRLSIDQVVGPLVLGKAVTLHPVVIIFALLVGAVLYGMLGIILAVPVAAMVKIVLQKWYETAG